MAAYIGKLLRFNGTTWDTFDIIPAAHSHDGSIRYVVGNTSGTAGTWTGTISDISAYYDGLTVAYKIGIAGGSTTTLNINGYGAKTVRRNDGNLTTHLPVNTVVVLVYTTISGTGYWVWADYDSTDPYQLRNNYYDVIGADTVYGYKIVAEGSDGFLYPLTTTGGVGTSKPVSTRNFKLGGHIKFYVTSGALSPGASTRYYMATQYSGDGLYTFNSSSGFVAGKSIYLKAVIQSDGSFKLDNTSVTSFYTQTLPTTDDGFIYIKLGTMHDTSRYITVLPDHPIYQFKDGCLRLLIQSHGHTFGVVAGTYAQGNDSRFVQGLAQFFSHGSTDGGISPDSVVNNCHIYANSLSLFGQTDGALYAQAHSSAWVHEIYGDYRTGQLAVRGKNNGSWTSWRIILDESNFTTYAAQRVIPNFEYQPEFAEGVLSRYGGNTHIGVGGNAKTFIDTTNFSTIKPDLEAIEVLSGTSGLLKKTAANTWTLDTTSYLPTTGGTVTGQIQHTPTTLATTGTVNIDFSGSNLRTQAALTGNITYTASNYAAGRSITIRVINGTTQRTLTFPSGWIFVGTKPTYIAASKRGILTITSFGTTEADCVAAWAVQA